MLLLFLLHFQAVESRKSIILDSIDSNKVVSPLPLHDVKGMYFHTFIIYEFMLCTAVTLSLTALILWHGRLISRGETSIEMHINKMESQRQKKKGIVSHCLVLSSYYLSYSAHIDSTEKAYCIILVWDQTVTEF